MEKKTPIKRRRRTSTSRKLPHPTLKRLTEYLVILEQALSSGMTHISSSNIAMQYCNTPSQVRQDIYQLAGSRRSGQGYSITQLIKSIRITLGLERFEKIAVVGCGRMGMGLAHNIPFEQYGMQLSALFDVRKELIGVEVVNGIKVTDIQDVKNKIKEEGISMVMLTVPDSVAQTVADQLVEAGIMAILNYAHERLRVPEHVEVKYQQVVCSLMELVYHTQWMAQHGEQK